MALHLVLAYIPILILFLGVVGNLLNIIVFAKRNMRESSTFRFLLYLSITDLIVLIIGASEMLIKSDVTLKYRDYSIFACNIQKFLTYSATYISSCISVAVSIDRAVIVSNLNTMYQNNTLENSSDELIKHTPKTSQSSSKSSSMRILSFRYMNRRLVDAIVVAIIILMLLLNIHYIFLLKASSIIFYEQSASNYSELGIVHLNATHENKSISEERENYEIKTCLPPRNTIYEAFLQHVWFWIDISVYSIIPFIFMGVCSMIIIVKIRKINKRYLMFMAKRTNQFNKNIYLKKLKKNVQICFMLVSTNLYFLLTMVVFWIWFLVRLEKSDETSNRSLTQSYVYVLLYTNNAFGFLFYGLSSKKYRHEFIGIVLQVCSIFSRNADQPS